MPDWIRDGKMLTVLLIACGVSIDLSGVYSVNVLPSGLTVVIESVVGQKQTVFNFTNQGERKEFVRKFFDYYAEWTKEASQDFFLVTSHRINKICVDGHVPLNSLTELIQNDFAKKEPLILDYALMKSL